MLVSLAEIKTHLGVSGTAEDAFLTQAIRRATALIRSSVKQYMGGVISEMTVANPTVCTSIGHGLETGDVINVFNSDSTPVIDDAQAITRLTDDTFTVAVNVTSAGTTATYARTYTEFYEGNGDRELLLKSVPVQSITSIHLDNDAYYGEASGAFGSDDLLVAGEDYALRRDNANQTEKSHTGMVIRIKGVWDDVRVRDAGKMISGHARGVGNIKAVYVAGYSNLPADIRLACSQMVAMVRGSADSGGGLASESLDYYSYSRVSPADESKAMDSVRSLLKRYKKWVW